MAHLAMSGMSRVGPDAPAEAAARAVARIDAAYGQALAHSRRVRLLRKGIPLACGAAFAALVVAPWLNPFRSVGNIGLGPLSLSGSKVTMDNPKLTGFRKDNKPYELIAKTATQDIRKPNVIELNDMNARLQMEQDGWVRLLADTGVFDSQKEQMQLRGAVKLRTDQGHDVQLKSADIDFKAATVNSREPVTVTSGGTRIDASALEVTDNGAKISFIGGVTAVVENSGVALSPNAGAAGQGASGTGSASGVRP